VHAQRKRLHHALERVQDVERVHLASLDRAAQRAFYKRLDEGRQVIARTDDFVVKVGHVKLKRGGSGGAGGCLRRRLDKADDMVHQVKHIDEAEVLLVPVILHIHCI